MTEIYTENVMKKLTISQIKRLSREEFRCAAKTPFVVVLDNVRSLNNIGSFFRTCDAFRIEAIFLCGISATPPHKEIHKTALGATESVAWRYFERTEQAIAALRAENYEVLAVEQAENSCLLSDFRVKKQKYALVFGHEVKGVTQKVIDLCDSCLEIPQYGTKHSFNVSVSAGIVLWEMFRQYQSIAAFS